MRGDLWSCPRCGRRFANTNQPHSCGRWTVDGFLRDASAHERALYDAFARAVHACGDVTDAPAKTRVGFQARMIFASVNRLKGGELRAHVVLTRRVEHARFTRVDELTPRCFVHHFTLCSPDEVDAAVRSWLAEAYDVGEQLQLRALPSDAPGAAP
jgi:hypothetical protein